ncbi:MAG: response regulator transcription factor [Chloroflexota bacterium]|nr:response regulator transcription factor [Chloroflexota bacterium]
MKALIVDDDRTLADLLAFTLRRAGFESLQAFDALTGLRTFEQTPVDIILLDVNLPGNAQLKSGFDVCRRIRETSNVPIILLTVRDDEDDIINGLNLGADDYILKPFSPRQLIARVKTILRRVGEAQIPMDEPFTFERLTFDEARRECHLEGDSNVQLTRLESRLMTIFCLNPNQVLTSDSLISHVWGAEAGSPEMLRQLVRRLRLKIETHPGEPKLVISHPGIGYRFAP